MLKKWYEKRPFTFGAVFIFFYMTIPIVDMIFINDKISQSDTTWIIIKK